MATRLTQRDAEALKKQGERARKSSEKQQKDIKKKGKKANKPQTNTRLQAAQKVRQQGERFDKLPLLLQLLVVVTVINWILNRRQDNQDVKAYNEAIKFLRESRGFRG